ncbi:type IV secretory system conjugative DNA transfer family protein [Jiella marina]|uniref:type IV secretory system conjugative DNA transfer family protein n=1 Tax=Jiella sp. LLJ827 TaxID=2917712 RepID=UPI0021011D6B|nr:type IV secretory system conjugative DNA transfer family protein [Jiella sp. LLJ827]MCQ0990548.1 type IV secretory system conjugative DNA transfer family protein [Jiella sp. LLJ827]
MDVLALFFQIIGFMLKLILRLLFAILRALGWLAGLPFGRTATSHGSARWARGREVWWSGAWGGRAGLIVGKYRGRFLRFKSEGYALIFARTRSGKGAGIVIPNLLTWPGSVICTDPKAENLAITGRDRARRGEVFSLNVITPELSDSFNPLQMIRVGTFHEADDATEIAKLLVIPDGGHSGHWDSRAVDLLKTLLLYICHRHADTPELRNLAKLRSLVALGWNGLDVIFEEASRMAPPSLSESARGWRGISGTDEARAILSNADKATGIWSADRPAGMVSMRSSFDFREFNRRTQTCFIAVDEEKLAVYSGFLRVMMGCALIAMTRAKSEAPPKTPTLLLIDEAAALGRLEPLETGVGYLAAYARMIMVWQDIAQLERTYPKAQSIMANAACKVVFGINDVTSAKTLAETIGHTTTYSRSSGRAARGQAGDQHSQNRSESGRYLIDPSEIMRLKPQQCIVFLSDAVRHPIWARKVRYWKVWRWRGRWDHWRPSRANVVTLWPSPSEEPTPARRVA